MNTSRVDVLGIGISIVDPESALATLQGWIDGGAREYVCVTGVHGVMESQADASLKAIHNDSGMTVPDGMPMVWCGKWAGAQGTARVYGPDWMLRVCQASVERGWTHYLYGGKEGVPELLRAQLESRFPGLKVVGTYSPPFRPLTQGESDDIANRINDAGPDIVWVGLSTPKQERWMAAHRAKLDAAALVGVGAAFDINAGLAKSAPSWVQRMGMEWLYRLIKEPRRLWRRYLKNNPRFIWAILKRPPVLKRTRST